MTKRIFHAKIPAIHATSHAMGSARFADQFRTVIKISVIKIGAKAINAYIKTLHSAADFPRETERFIPAADCG